MWMEKMSSSNIIKGKSLIIYFHTPPPLPPPLLPPPLPPPPKVPHSSSIALNSAIRHLQQALHCSQLIISRHFQMNK